MIAKKFQRGGTMIYDVDTELSVPDIKYVPTLDLPELKLSPLTSALDTYTKIRQDELDTMEKNFQGLTVTRDALSKVRYDNDRQKNMIESAKARAGLTEDMLNMSPEQLKNPYILSPIARAANEFTNSMELRDLLKEQAIYDANMAAYQKSPPSNPILKKMFLEQEAAYKRGELSGKDLDIRQFVDFDIGKDLVSRIKDVPVITQSELKTIDGFKVEEVVKQRSKDAILKLIADRRKDPLFENNMIARGYVDRDGNLTAEGSDYIESIADAYAQQNIELANVKEIKGAGKLTGTGPDANAAANLAPDLKGVTAAAFNALYEISSNYGIALEDDPALRLRILGNLDAMTKTTESVNATDNIKAMQREIRRVAMQRGNGLKALYDQAVEDGYTGLPEDFAQAITANDWKSIEAGAVVIDSSIRRAAETLGGNSVEQLWNTMRQRMSQPATSPQAAFTPPGSAAPNAAPSADGGAPVELDIRIGDFFSGASAARQGGAVAGASQTTGGYTPASGTGIRHQPGPGTITSVSGYVFKPRKKGDPAIAGDKFRLGKKQQKFVADRYNLLYEAAKKRGVKNPHVIALIGAAATGVEAGYDLNSPAPFGVKFHHGAHPDDYKYPRQNLGTKEFNKATGKMEYRKDQWFRKYPNIEAAATDYIDFMINNRKKSRYGPFLNSDEINAAIEAMGASGYATDPYYKNKLRWVLKHMGVI